MAELTDKQKLFCIYHNESDNGTESAIRAGYTVNSAAVTASKMLRLANIIQYKTFLKQTVEQIFVGNSKNALETILTLMNDKKQSGTVRLKASQDLLDRAGYKATDKIRITANVEHSGSVASTKEIHIFQELLNRNDDLADAILKSISDRNVTMVIPELVTDIPIKDNE
jgi:hypothetical protein